MNSRINYGKTSFVFDWNFDLSQGPSAKNRQQTVHTMSAHAGECVPTHPLKSSFVWAMPVAAMVLFGQSG